MLVHQGFVAFATYGDEEVADAALADLAALELRGLVVFLATAAIRRDLAGRVRLVTDESSTRGGALGGLLAGGLVGLAFLPALPFSVAGGAAAGALLGHLHRGISRGHLHGIAAGLDRGRAALMVVGRWRGPGTPDLGLWRAERTCLRPIRLDHRFAVDLHVAFGEASAWLAEARRPGRQAVEGP